ncbi:hypothetical protein YSY43_19880 [Paenibacillus sp. YSY-4.3]
MLFPGEVAVAAYRTLRDSAIYTNKRLIVGDAQGFHGEESRDLLVAYSSIDMRSTENSGGFLDMNAEVEL